VDSQGAGRDNAAKNAKFKKEVGYEAVFFPFWQLGINRTQTWTVGLGGGRHDRSPCLEQFGGAQRQ